MKTVVRTIHISQEPPVAFVTVKDKLPSEGNCRRYLKAGPAGRGGPVEELLWTCSIVSTELYNPEGRALRPVEELLWTCSMASTELYNPGGRGRPVKELLWTCSMVGTVLYCTIRYNSC